MAGFAARRPGANCGTLQNGVGRPVVARKRGGCRVFAFQARGGEFEFEPRRRADKITVFTLYSTSAPGFSTEVSPLASNR